MNSIKSKGAECNSEEYRFWFLLYLDVAEKLIELRTSLEYVKRMQKLFESGRTFDDSENQTAEWVEGFLYEHYGMEWSRSGFYEAVGRLQADLHVTESLEDVLWRKTYESCQKIWQEAAWFNTAVQTRISLSENRDALRRIQCYRKALREVSEALKSPMELETKFRSVHGELLRLVPIEP